MTSEVATGATVGDAMEPESVVRPLSAMRRVIGARLTESKRSAPHFYLSLDVELEATLTLRKRLQGELTEGVPTVNDFLIAAASRALRSCPELNARVEENQIRRFSTAHMGVAVSLGSGGLVVPNVRNASELDVFAISVCIRELVEKARINKLTPDDYRGGTFTVSNLGMYGVREFIAILNPPQAGILALGQAAPRPVVKDGAVQVATVLTATLSADHRAVDGTDGARFLLAFQTHLQSPETLLERAT